MRPKKSRHNTDMPPPTPDSENCFNNIMVIWKTIPPLWGLKPRGLDSPLFTLLIFLFSSSPNSTFPQFLLCMFPLSTSPSSSLLFCLAQVSHSPPNHHPLVLCFLRFLFLLVICLQYLFIPPLALPMHPLFLSFSNSSVFLPPHQPSSISQLFLSVHILSLPQLPLIIPPPPPPSLPHWRRLSSFVRRHPCFVRL